MGPGLRQGAAGVLRVVAVAASLVLTTLACPAQSKIAAGKPQALQPFDQRLALAQRQLALVDKRVAGLSAEESARLTSFVLGNIVFILVHELGHAVINQLRLPVLGREEDAADTFATLSMLLIGTEQSHSVLREAARGFHLIARRDKGSDPLPEFYDEHGLDMQRAYQIVCLMVGSDRKSFKDIAGLAKIPSKRQETCEFDFERAAHSWESLLEDRSRAASWSRSSSRKAFARTRPAEMKSRLKVDYGKRNNLSGYRSVLKAAGVLETVARFARETLSLPRPMTLRAMKCGKPDAYYDDRPQQIVMCFELVEEFIELGLSSSGAGQGQ